MSKTIEEKLETIKNEVNARTPSSDADWINDVYDYLFADSLES